MSRHDIHNYQRKVQTILKGIRNSDAITQANKDDLDDFYGFLQARGMSNARMHRYLGCIKKIMEYEDNDFRLKEMTEKQVLKVLTQIQQSAYYHSSYQPSTRAEYRKTTKRYLEFADKTDLLPEGFTTTVSESNKQRVDPKEIPQPDDVRKLAQALEGRHEKTGLRDAALLMTLWDAGCRPGEAIQMDIEDLAVEDDLVMARVPGNKQSPDRDVPLYVAAPSLKRYLETLHPDPTDARQPLFVSLNGSTRGDRLSHRTFYKHIKQVGKQTNVSCAVRPEIYRKGRISWLKKSDTMSESLIDKRVGHVQGSDTTREYTRLSDTDAANAYLDSMGLEGRKMDIQEDLLPQRCDACGQRISGHRNTCYCGAVLEDAAVPMGENVNIGTEAAQNRVQKRELQQLIDESGMDIQNLVDVLKALDSERDATETPDTTGDVEAW